MSADLPELSGDRVTLVPVRPGTTAAVLNGDLGGRAAARGWPHDDTALALAFTEAGGSTWLVIDPDGAIAGELGTKATPDARGVVEIGYGLAAPSRGVGLGTRAVATLVAWLVQRTDVRAVIAHVAVQNLPSRRLLERLGFGYAGEVGSDEVAYRLPAPD
jgi:RimJ/RimL family protein N-acetyltransferase